jgi:hypothetical protein
MVNQAKKIQNFLTNNIPKHPNDIVAITMKHFDIAKTTANRHLQHLIKANKVLKTGRTKQVRYSLAGALNQEFSIAINKQFDEFTLYSTLIEPAIKAYLSTEALDILEYCATEMLNNCHDHSSGKQLTISIEIEKTQITLSISDNGVGLFKHIHDSFHFEDMRDVMLELSKGKLTTDAENHTGEGIFFSSRACNIYSITANNYCYEKNNQENDWSFHSVDKTQGTTIKMTVARNSEKNLTDIFLKYQDDDSLEFTKTDIVVELSKSLGERLISRSQAKRILRRLENFKHITLDFENIQTVGQGFVDEIFRVYQNKNPQTTFIYTNANDDVTFMIERGLANQ